MARRDVAGPDDGGDASDLLPIAEFRAKSETDVVIALLQSNGVPAICGGRYDLKAPKRVLVPRRDVDRARRVIADAQMSGKHLTAGAEKTTGERRSLGTAFSWILAIGALGYGLFVTGRFIRDLIRYMFG